MGIETAVDKKGKNIVTIEDVNEAASQFKVIMGNKEKEEKTTKIAVVRCDIVSETCPGVACFKAFNKQNFYGMKAYYYIGCLESFIAVRNYTNR